MDYVYIVVESEGYDAVDVGMFQQEDLVNAIKFAVAASKDEERKEEAGNMTYYIYKVKFGKLPHRREECIGMYENGEKI